MSKRTALVAGATGLVGGELLRLLVERTEYDQVTALLRRPLPWTHPKLIQKVVNFDDPGLYASPVEADDFFCCLGTTMKKAGSKEAFRKVDLEYPLALADLALASGGNTFLLVSSIGADPQSRVFYSQVKGQAEQALRTRPIPSLHIFRPSLLVGARQEFRLGESVGYWLMKLIGFALAGPLKKYRAIHAQTVARAMVRAALRGEPGAHVYESDTIELLGRP